MSENIEHFYRPDSEEKALVPGCIMLFLFLALGTGFFVGLVWLVSWIS